MRIAALVKQIPAFEAMELGADGRLRREGLPLEMSAYCRRAVAQAVALVESYGGEVVVVTLGPPAAEDVVREAIAYGDGAGRPEGARPVAITGIHVCDPAFAGSDTLATAHALAATIGRLEAEGGRFDVILVGRNSVDADTGQVGPQIAQLLDRPFATGVKRLTVAEDVGHPGAVEVGLELDDLWEEATVMLPAVLSVAERLIDPCKIKDPSVWASVDASRIRRVTAAELGGGPWGAEASPTKVGETRIEAVERAGAVLGGSVAEQVDKAVAFLLDRGALGRDGPSARTHSSEDTVPAAAGGPIATMVVIEPDRRRLARELLGTAARLAARIGGRVIALGTRLGERRELAAWGADEVVAVEGLPDPEVAEDVAAAVIDVCLEVEPWAVLVGGTPWGREVAARTAAALGAGLTGDAIGLTVDRGRLVAWKPAFGGSLVAAIRCSSPIQMVTVRPGVLPTLEPRPAGEVDVRSVHVVPRGRLTVRERRRDDDADVLAHAEVVIGVGQGVPPDRYGELEGLRSVLGAEFAATRKVTDQGWLPHARQLGITGKSIAPRLYVAIGTSGKYNHLVGVRTAGTILAVNPDPGAPIFSACDIGIVGDWSEVVPELESRLRAIAL
ncbi:MAG: FAD-binding protein [Acidimicrobiales bacterium]|nr:FAD-binding protein [Acidimicrobiales bacterium]